MGKESSNSFYVGLIIISSSVLIYWLNSKNNKKPLKKIKSNIFLVSDDIQSESIDNYDNTNIQNNYKLPDNNTIISETANKILIDINEDKITVSESEDEGYQSDISSLADELNYTTIDSKSIPPHYQKEILSSDLTTESETDSVSKYIPNLTKIKYKKFFKKLFPFKSCPYSSPDTLNDNDNKNKQ